MLNYPFPIEEKKLFSATREIINQFLGKEAKVRITLALNGSIGEIYITIADFSPLTEGYHERGAHTITCDLVRDDPGAKGTQHLKRAALMQTTFNSHIEEALLLTSENEILEGVYKSVRENVGPYKSNVYTIDTSTGEIDVWGTTSMDMCMMQVNIGDKIKLLYEGKVPSKNRPGKEFHSFKVYKDEPDSDTGN